VRDFKNPNQKSNKKKTSAPPFAKKAKKELADIFETAVDVKVSKSGKGQLVVPFKNQEDFQRILKLIKSEK
jgi:ParB family chromosome partitioning protein